MKKTVIILSVTVIFSIIVFGLLYNHKTYINLPFETQETINNNNYSDLNSIDYAYGKFAFLKNNLFNTKLTILNAEHKSKNLYGIKSPFRIYKDIILYLSDSDLTAKNIDNGKNTIVANDVKHFLIFEDKILYCTKSNSLLYIQKIYGNQKEVLFSGVEKFYIYNENVFVIDKENLLTEISLKDFTKNQIAKLEIQGYPFEIMVQNRNLIILDSTNQFDILNLDTKNTISFSMSEKSYDNNKTVFICDDDMFYYSFQATEMNGSIVKNIRDTNNGLWSVNLTTLEKEQIVKETFNELYLYDENMLIGLKDNCIYRIDTINKNYEKLVD